MELHRGKCRGRRGRQDLLLPHYMPPWHLRDYLWPWRHEAHSQKSQVIPQKGILRQVTQHRAGCGFSHVCLPALLPNVKQAGTRASEASPDPSLSSVGGLGVPSKSILLPYEVWEIKQRLWSRICKTLYLIQPLVTSVFCTVKFDRKSYERIMVYSFPFQTDKIQPRVQKNFHLTADINKSGAPG